MSVPIILKKVTHFLQEQVAQFEQEWVAEFGQDSIRVADSLKKIKIESKGVKKHNKPL